MFRKFRKSVQQRAAMYRLKGTSRGREFHDAITTAKRVELSQAEQRIAEQIESLRSEMAADGSMLDSWDQPWLERSDYLKNRFSQSDSTRHSTSMSISKAVEASKKEKWCRLLLTLVRNTKPEVVVEMGTNVGISGLYIAAALELNGRGRLITMDGSAPKLGVARRNFEKVNLLHRVEFILGDFNETLKPALERVGPVDLAFIDGFHDGLATTQFHEIFKLHSKDQSIFVYDDIRWSEPMTDAWREIQKDRDLDTILDLGNVGLCSLGKDKRVQAALKY